MENRLPLGLLLFGSLLAAGLAVSLSKRGGLEAEEDRGSFTKVNVQLIPQPIDADGQQVVTVKLTIAPGWHIYANPVQGPDYLVKNQTALAIVGPLPPEAVKVDYPEGKLKNEPGIGEYRVYEGEVELKATLRRPAGDTGPLELNLHLQACNDTEKVCLAPGDRKYKLP